MVIKETSPKSKVKSS